MSEQERDCAVGEFIDLVAALDGILAGQARADSEYFLATCGRRLGEQHTAALEQTFLRAYRWQYIVSGARHPHFVEVLVLLTSAAQLARVSSAVSAVAEASNLA